ncbi:MAG: hypothetical protein HY551_06810 [Elusimicrobia bacterium]|nr:hypothetical protein [Elusimicrobiota bacterium]
MRRLILVATGCLVLAGLLWAGLRFGGNLTARRERWRYPAPKGPSVTPMGREILEKRGEAWVRRFTKSYDGVLLKLTEAQRQGFDISGFEPKVARAVEAARQGRYQDALMLLNVIEVQIPRKAASAVRAEPSRTTAESDRARRTTKRRPRRPDTTP